MKFYIYIAIEAWSTYNKEDNNREIPTISILVKQAKGFLKLDNLFFTQSICHGVCHVYTQREMEREREREIERERERKCWV